jgi:hypothetical protein
LRSNSRRHAAEQHPFDTAEPSRPHEETICSPALRLVKEDLLRVTELDGRRHRWGRFRYDVVAFGALVVALFAGVVPKDELFSGFGHPATIIVALVLIVSRGLSNSGAVELLARHIVDASRTPGPHIGIMAGLAAALSAVSRRAGVPRS